MSSSERRVKETLAMSVDFDPNWHDCTDCGERTFRRYPGTRDEHIECSVCGRLVWPKDPGWPADSAKPSQDLPGYEAALPILKASPAQKRNGALMSCECDDWSRCAKHAAMMRAIRKAYQSPAATRGLDRRIYLAADGFGEGTDPDTVEWDWSGIRDSTPAAVEVMYAEVQRG